MLGDRVDILVIRKAPLDCGALFSRILQFVQNKEKNNPTKSCWIAPEENEYFHSERFF